MTTNQWSNLSINDTSDPYKKPASFVYAIPFILLFLILGFSNLLWQSTGNLTGAADTVSNPQSAFAFALTYGFAGLLLLQGRAKIYLSLMLRSISYILLLIYILNSLMWSSFPHKVFVNWVHLVGLSFVALSLVKYTNLETDKFIKIITITMGIITYCSLITVVLFPGVGIQLGSGRWQGTLPHPNTLALISMISIWASSIWVLSVPIQKKFIPLSFFIIAWILIIGTQGMTSTVLSLMFVTYLFGLRIITNDKGSLLIMKLMLLTLGVIAMIGFVFILQPELLTVQGQFQLIGRDSSLTGRVALWEIAIKLINEKPILGWSFDSNRSAFSAMEIGYGQFHNGYLDLLVRGGFVSIILVVIMLIEISVYCKFCIKKQSFYALSIFGLLLIILIHNLTEASLVRAPNALWTMLVLIYFYLQAKHLKKD